MSETAAKAAGEGQFIYSHQLQKHKTSELNRDFITVTRYGDEGPGGAYHEYGIYLRNGKESDPPVVILKFQNGPLREVGCNGITEEALLAIVIDRLMAFQRGNYSCRQNAIAITKLEEALHWMGDRTREREIRGVEGTMKV